MILFSSISRSSSRFRWKIEPLFPFMFSLTLRSVGSTMPYALRNPKSYANPRFKRYVRLFIGTTYRKMVNKFYHVQRPSRGSPGPNLYIT
ncbi:hypothetical protein BDW75DRAFT_69247 [Aspergillus navahoensis]